MKLFRVFQRSYGIDSRGRQVCQMDNEYFFEAESLKALVQKLGGGLESLSTGCQMIILPSENLPPSAKVTTEQINSETVQFLTLQLDGKAIRFKAIDRFVTIVEVKEIEVTHLSEKSLAA